MGRKRKSRREYGSGSILRNTKLKKYTVRWYDGEGKHRSCSKFSLTPDGKRAAEAFLAQMNDEALNPKKVANSLGYWILAVLKEKKKAGRLSSHNQRKYAAGMLPNAFIETPIDKILPETIMKTYMDLSDRGVANATIHRIHWILKEAFQTAKANRAIEINPMPDVKPPSGAGNSKNRKDIMSWRELGELFHYLKHRKYKQVNPDYVLLFRLLYCLGCRIGELQALQWADVNWNKREIHIQRTVSGANGRLIMPPKTASGDRYVPIFSDRTYKMLRNAYESTNNKSGYIFAARGSGKSLLYGTIHRVWSKCSGGHTIHCLRHTRASHLISAGFPIPEVSRILGHANPGITMQIYVHSLPNQNDRLLKLYQSALKRI